MVAEPAPRFPIVRPTELDERPEAAPVVRLDEVAQLVDDDVVEHLGRREGEPPVQRDRAAWRARAPAGPLAGDPDPRGLQPLGGRNASRLRANAAPALPLAEDRQRRRVWAVGKPALHPRCPALDQSPDLTIARPARDDEQRAAAGRQLDARAASALGDADLDLHGLEASGRARRCRWPHPRGLSPGRAPRSRGCTERVVLCPAGKAGSGGSLPPGTVPGTCPERATSPRGA